MIYVLTKPSSNTDYLLTLIVALITSLIFSHFGEQYRLNSLIGRIEYLISTLGRLYREKKEGTFLRNILEHGTIAINAERFPKVWHELLWSIQRSYCTTVVTCDTEMELSHNRLGLEIQRVKVQVAHVDIRRIFIVDSDAARERLAAEMQAQKDAGIHVRWILKSAVDSNHMLKPWLKKVRSIDFSIIDGTFVLITTVNKRTKVASFELTDQSEHLQLYEEFYNAMFAEANEIPESSGETND